MPTWSMAFACTWWWLVELDAGGGGELVWTDHGAPNPGDEPALCSSWAGRFGNAAPRPPGGTLPAVPVPLLIWWATDESIWTASGLTGAGEGDAASGSAAASGEPRRSGRLRGRWLTGPRGVGGDSAALEDSVRRLDDCCWRLFRPRG